MPDARPEDLSPSFHARFALALNGDDQALTPWLPDASAAPGLSVYRNTVAKGRADALAGLFPAVERLVGADWFQAVALEYARERPPASPVLDDYGDDFPDWLAAFPPAQAHAWLPPVARLDRAWSQAHRAADAPILSPQAAAAVSPPRLYAGRLILHPSARAFWFDWTAPSIWLANRGQGATGDMVWDQKPEGLLIVRSRMTVLSHRLTAPQFAFLSACRDRQTVSAAVVAALAADKRVALSSLFRDLLLTGVFTRFEPGPSE